MWFKIHDSKVELLIFAKPNAKKTELLAIDVQGLHIALHAKPSEGEANQELILYLAKTFQLPKKQIVLKHGEKGRHKKVVMPMNKIIQQFLDDSALFTKKKK